MLRPAVIPLLLAAQIAAAGQQDSTYATPALRELVAAVAAENHAPPPDLLAYRARVETELSFILRDTLGRERAGQIEQIESAAHWQRGGQYDLHVVGYRSQSIGSVFSALSIVNGWTVPVLYGERLLIGVEAGSANDRTRTIMGRRGRDTVIAVHPFAADRDSFYRFSGGDTITVLHSAGRAIPIVLIRVVPLRRDTTSFAAFDGEIEVDAVRHQIVRMRGQFLVLRRSADRPAILRVPGVTGAIFVEFVNAEVDQKYWLPAFERTEFQASMALLASERSVFRIVSQFRDMDVENGTTTAADDGQRIRSRVTWAPGDSISRFGDWSRELGDETSKVRADDFADLAPDPWRPSGAPRWDFLPTKVGDIFRYNRVEGFYTGVSGALHFRDLAPGLTTGADVGWAWAERTARGGARVVWDRDDWIYGARAERRLTSTNDFELPFAGGDAVSALIGSIDDADYVDRRLGALTATRVLGGVDEALLTGQLAYASDGSETARLTRGLIHTANVFRPNRGSLNGNYGLATVDFEFHPNVTGDFVQPGVGARVHLEAAAGQLGWQRAEVGLSGRRYWGPVALAMHIDAGAVTARTLPPQQLFEIGGTESFPGYLYKQFAGDRAALARGFANYVFPVLRTPRRVWRGYVIPGLAPGIGGSIQAGWTGVTSAAADTAVAQLTPWSLTPLSTPSGRVRATAEVGLTFLSGALHIGVARALDHPDHWRFAGGFGQTF